MSGTANRPDVPPPQSDASTGRFTFALRERVQLGTPDVFLTWVNKQFGTRIPSVAELRAQAPGPLQAVVEQLLRATIAIDALMIETGPAAHWRFAASVDFTAAPLQLGSFLELDRVGFRVENRKAAGAGAPAA